MTNAEHITERSLSERTGVARSVIAGLRSAHLTPGDDFANVAKSGIVFTDEGHKKIEALLAPLLAGAGSGDLKNGGAATAAPAVATAAVTLIVAGPSRNGGRSCLCYREGVEPLRRAFVFVPGSRLKASTLSRGMRLEGCVPMYPGNDEVFTYPGPVPHRLGMALPPPAKKEVAP